MHHRFRPAALATTLTFVALVAACGGNDATTTTSAPTTSAAMAYPVTVTGAAGDVTLEARPERIVSLSPTHTEMLFALGAGDQIVAVDDQSDFPAEVESKPRDLSGFQPNVEAIAAYEPDLVVIADDFTGLTGQFAPLGIPVWSGATATTFDDVYAQLEQLGVLTGRIAEATVVVADLQAEIDELVASIEPVDPPLTYYHELDDTYFSVTSQTFIGEVYALFGLRNIADAAGTDSAYPQLSAEFIVEQGPDLIFLACTVYCGTTAESVGQRPGWDAIPAVVNGAIIELDDDVVSRWGPRVVEFVRAVADALVSLEARVG